MNTAQARNTAVATAYHMLKTGHRAYIAYRAGEMAGNSADALALNLLLSEECTNYEGHWDSVPMFDASHTGVWYGSLEGVGA